MKTFNDFLVEATNFKIGDTVKEKEWMGQFKKDQILYVVGIGEDGPDSFIGVNVDPKAKDDDSTTLWAEADNLIKVAKPKKKTLEDIKKELAEYQMKEVGELTFQVSLWNGKLSVSYDLTYRRNNPAGAFRQYASHINRGNAILQSIADQYKDRKPKLNLMTAADVDKNGEYSEYEQSFGASVEFK